MKKERKGAASLYVVIFATILFGVITLSFIRIILSEATQTSNDDLSQSAYDSAMAGVEDAKIAVNQYYQCLSSGKKYDECTKGVLFKEECEDSSNGQNVIGVAKYLYQHYEEGEIKIQESTANSKGESNGTEQAYTCVTISDVTEDYRSTLTSDTRIRVVPIVVNDGMTNTGSLANIAKVEFSWYSETNGTVFSNLNNNGLFGDKNNSTTPPVISLSVLATPQSINLNSFNSDDNLNFSTSILLPNSDTRDTDDNEQAWERLKNSRIEKDNSFPSGNQDVKDSNTISSARIIANANAGKGASNTPKYVRCTHSEFACSVTLDVKEYLRSATNSNPANGNFLLVISMPYGDTVTDFMVKVTKDNGEIVYFDGAQIKVDSTGRANQLVRRVETRLDPADIFFPYPQFELELTGDPNDALRKSFWITNNCWTEKGYCNNNGQI